VYEHDRSRIDNLLAGYSTKSGTFPDPMAAIEARYPKLPPLTADEKQLICRTRKDDWLSKVRAQRDDMAALLARQPTRLKKDMAFAQDDYEWNDLKPTVFALPPYGSTQNLWLTSAALDFADGRTAQALASVCTNALTMRRLHAHNNTLAGTMIAAARMQGAAGLFDHMLSELPLDQPLPESCHQAFAQPAPTDIDLSAGMQWELRLSVIQSSTSL
jgi:hypothetical protein